MLTAIEETFLNLIKLVSSIKEVQSIGRSGGRPLPASPADGDIDVFIYCDEIPSSSTRRDILKDLNAQLSGITVDAIGGGHWGKGDLVHIGGIETWLMYFTTDEALAEVDNILDGKFPDRMGGYYPTGRCGMLAGIEILCDKTGFLSELKERLAVYPEGLSKRLVDYHLRMLNDTEDFERAAARKDVLFYHFALETALDHFMQALFAMNRVYFPSRKRSLEYITEFQLKPADCEARLLEVLRLGGNAGDIGQSYECWCKLVQELNGIYPEP